MNQLQLKEYKHLTLNDRISIQSQLLDGASFKSIAQLLSKDPTTISKEIKRNRSLFARLITNILPLMVKILNLLLVLSSNALLSSVILVNINAPADSKSKSMIPNWLKQNTNLSYPNPVKVSL